jgi:hypothetical protein
MVIIFSDFIIERLDKDSADPGVFVKARKPRHFAEMDLSNVKLYSMVVNERVRNFSTPTSP